jgi:hypothetical protein
MSESKHTSAPWVVDYCAATGRPLGISAPNDAGVPGAVGHIVRLRGIGLPSSEMARANARLIAAAPDLLEACKSAISLLHKLGGHNHDPEYSQLEAAIYKAVLG